MDKKKVIVSSIIGFIVVALVVLFSYFFFIKQDENSTLTLADKQWIEKNKNNVIDLGILNNIAVFSYGGSGVLFDFVDSLEESTELKFNKLSYEINNKVPTEYSFEFVSTIGENDIVFFEDTYTLFSRENTKYNTLEEIPSMTLGVLNSDLENVNYYLNANSGLRYKTYADVDAMVKAVDSGDIGAIVLPQILYFDALAKDDTFYSAYNITEMGQSLVLH